MSELNIRMEGFARQQLALGKGSWWVVDELARIGHIDKAAARAMVDRVAPEVYTGLVRRRLPFLRMGVLVTAIGFFLMGLFALHGSFEFFLGGLAIGALVIGTGLLSYGWPGLQNYRPGDPIPGPGLRGPVRLGLTLRAEPFEKV